MGFKPGEQGFKPGEQGFKPGEQGFKPGEQGFKPGEQGFKPGEQGFKPGEQGFKPGEQGILGNAELVNAAKKIAAFIAQDDAMSDLVTVIAAQIFEIRKGASGK